MSERRATYDWGLFLVLALGRQPVGVAHASASGVCCAADAAACGIDSCDSYCEGFTGQSGLWRLRSAAAIGT